VELDEVEQTRDRPQLPSRAKDVSNGRDACRPHAMRHALLYTAGAMYVFAA
jgi:hypothetical protein